MRRPRMVCVCQREGQADVVWCACACGAVVVAGESSTHRMPASVLRQDHHKRGGGVYKAARAVAGRWCSKRCPGAERWAWARVWCGWQRGMHKVKVLARAENRTEHSLRQNRHGPQSTEQKENVCPVVWCIGWKGERQLGCGCCCPGGTNSQA